MILHTTVISHDNGMFSFINHIDDVRQESLPIYETEELALAAARQEGFSWSRHSAAPRVRMA